MRLYKSVSLIVLACLFSGFLFAKDIQKEKQILLKMVDIKVEKTTDKGEGVDDLFFNITQYSNLQGERETRVPEYPTHWLSTQLPKLKNVVLWEGKIAEDETLKLTLSLMGEHALPWDPNDAIGAVEVILLNQKGRLKIQWAVPRFAENTSEVEMLKHAVPQRYIFKGFGSRYYAAFSVEQK